MIHLIGIGDDKGNITLNAFIAIKEADIIINYNDIDLTFFDTEIKDKELISAIDLINGTDSEDNLDEEFIMPNLLERFMQENYVLDYAISKSLERKSVVIIASDDPSILGLSNRFLQMKSKYQDVKYRIYPCISSVDISASLIGAPLADYAVIDLANPLSPMSDIENKIRHSLDADLVLVIKNPIDERLEDGKTAFKLLRNIVNEKNGKLLTACANARGKYSISEFEDIDEENINRNTVIFIGNKLSYLLDGKMVTSSDYVVKPEIISWSYDFFEKYLNGESPRGLDYDCDYLPCHKSLEACDFCYCPFYPCADGITGGEWIKDKDVWSCQNCDWIHLEEPCLAIREGLDEILKDIDDLTEKHIELLRLRRECLLKTLK